MKGDKKKKAMFDRYASRLMSQGGNRTTYLRWVQAMLDYFEDADFYDEEVTRRKLQGFFRKMERTYNYNSGTMRLLWATIRSFFSRNLLPWPFGRGEAPQVNEAEVIQNAPALAPELINEIIQIVKAEGTDKQKAMLALSTTYGMKRVEMQRIGRADVRLKDRTLHVATANNGRARSHLIPEEIVPYLSKHDFDLTRSASGMSMIWYEIEDLAKVEHYPQVGFHSIRRTLLLLLLKEAREPDVYSFLRYSQNPVQTPCRVFVDRTGAANDFRSSLSNVDKRIFDKHPFLARWTEGVEHGSLAQQGTERP